MKFLVTGAAGFIGSHMVSYLLRMGHQVHATDMVAPRYDSGCEFSVCDLLDRPRVIDLFRDVGATHIIHLAAETRVLGLSRMDYSVNVEGVQNVIEAIKRAPYSRRVIMASTRLICPVYSPPAHLWDYRPPNLYGESKVLGEQIVVNSKLNVPWVIVRPTGIWGPMFRSPSYRDFFIQIKKRRYFHIKGVSPVRTFGYVKNTVYQIYQLSVAAENIVSGSVHYLGDYEPLRVRNWADMISMNFGNGRLVELPMFVANTGAWLGSSLTKLGINSFPLNVSRLDNMTSDSVYDLVALARLAPNLPVGLEEATKTTTNWIDSGEPFPYFS